MTETKHSEPGRADGTISPGTATLMARVEPRLRERLGDSNCHRLWIWCPGCGEGVATYALAAIVADHPRVLSGDVELSILGTDPDPEVIRRASSAIYREASVECFSRFWDEGHLQYLQDHGEGVRVDASLRDHCVFARHDVLGEAPLAGLDLIFAPEHVRLTHGPVSPAKLELTYRLFHFALRDGGLLAANPDASAVPPRTLFQPLESSPGLFVSVDAEADWRPAVDSGVPEVREALRQSDGASDAPGGRAKLFEALQVALEELHCSREEYRVISEQLGRTNDELHEKIRDLRRANTDLENLFASTEIPTIFVDRNLIVRRFTASASRLYRFGARDVGRPLVDVRSRFQGPDILDAVREVIRTEERRELRIELPRADDVRSYLLRVGPYRGLDGATDGAVLTFVDVTEIEQARRRANAGETQQATLARLGESVIAGEPLPELVEEAIRELCRVLHLEAGWVLEDAVGDSAFVRAAVGLDAARGDRIVLPDGSAGRRALEDYYPVIIEDLFDAPDVQYPPALTRCRMVSGITTALAGPDGPFGLLGVHGTVGREFSESDANFVHSVGHLLSSATLRRRAEHQLAENEGRLRRALKAAPFPLFLISEEGVFKLVSDEFFALTGHEAKAPAEMEPWPEQFCPELSRLIREYADEFFDRRIPELDGVYRVVTAAGEERQWRIHSAPMGTSSDGHRLVVSVAVDVTDQLARTRELSTESRQKDDFLAMLGHELRNPLNAVRGSAELLAHAEDDESVQRVRRILDRQTRHMSQLIDGLLDVSRVMRGKIRVDREPVEFAELVAVTVQDYGRRADELGVELRFERPPEDVWVDGDDTRLVQIVNNLVSNALKFTRDGGEIVVRLWARDGEAVLDVSDDGIGIEPDLIAHIFDAFRQSDGESERDGGLGLGLALARGLAELHDGTIEAASEGDGEGARFTVRLPLGHPPASAGNEERRPPVARDFLLIEDHEDSAELFASLLEALGNSVRVAHTGNEGLEALAESTPDVVLCDIGLPDMSGHEVAREIRSCSEYDEVILIALTGYGRRRDVERALDAGFDAHLTKPMDVDDLEDLLVNLS